MMVGYLERIVFIKGCNEIYLFIRCNILSYNDYKKRLLVRNFLLCIE